MDKFYFILLWPARDCVVADGATHSTNREQSIDEQIPSHAHTARWREGETRWISAVADKVFGGGGLG